MPITPANLASAGPGHARPKRATISAGQAVADATSEMMAWTVDEIQECADSWPNGSTRFSWAQITSARWLLRAMSDATTSNGSPIAERALANLFDRTVGKPNQTIDVNQTRVELRVTGLTDSQLADLRHITEGTAEQPVTIVNSHALLDADAKG